MALRKSIIKDFVYRVRSKAIESVQEKHKEIILAEAEKLFATPEGDKLKQAFADYLSCGKKYDEAIQTIADLTGVYKTSNFREDIVWTVFNSIYWLPKTELYAPIRDAHTAWEKERGAVSDQYQKLLSTIESAKSAKEAFNIVSNLGFDTTWIEEQSKSAVSTETLEEFDKDKLFVCGERA